MTRLRQMTAIEQLHQQRDGAADRALAGLAAAAMHGMIRLASLFSAAIGRRLTYAELIA